MNPESLENYKLQVYNPGSPYPSPKSDSFKAFPTVTITNPENPLKLTFSNRKRSRTTDSDDCDLNETSSVKKPKMMKEEDVKALFKELRSETKEDMESFKKDFAKTFAEEQAKANSQTNSQFSSIQTQLSTITQTLDLSDKTAADNKAEADARMKALEDRMDQLEKEKNEPANEHVIQDVVKNFVDTNTSDTTAWKASLAKDVFEAEHGIIIHGVKLIGVNDDVRKAFIKTFLKDVMKAPEDILNKVRVKEVTRLGNDNAAKPPPILVRFGHPTERNLILPLSSNLKEGIDVDKNVPKIYLKKHKEFKRHAWKLKLLYNVKSQVVFEGCNMIVRYKKNDEGVTQFNWVVAKEWHPEPSDLQAVLSTSSVKDPNKHDTPIIDISVSAECNKTVIATGVKDVINNENVKGEILSIVSNQDHELIQDVRYKGNGVVLKICKDWASCSHIVKTYNKKNILGKQVFLTMFSETDPNELQ